MSNGKNLTALAVKLGMRYYEEQNLLFGRLSGYECAVREQPEKKMIMLHVIARPAAQEDMGMERLLEQLQQEYPAVMAAVYENFTASLRLSTATDEDLLQQAETLLRRITDFAKKEDYRPCCQWMRKNKGCKAFPI